MVKPWDNDIDNITIQRCTFDGTDDHALSFYPGRSDLGATPSASRDSYIAYNTITNFGRRNDDTCVGIHINNDAHDILIERNTITTGAAGSTRGSAIMMDCSEPLNGYFPTDITVRYNDVRVTEGNWAMAFQQTQAGAFLVHHNKFSALTACTDTSSGGINVMNSPTRDYVGGDIQLQNNTIYVTGGRGINANTSAASAVTLKNNLVYHTGADPLQIGVVLG